MRQAIAGWWWWNVSRRLTREKLTQWIAWRVPRSIAYWCFIRVYTASTNGAPSDDVIAAMKAWQAAK